VYPDTPRKILWFISLTIWHEQFETQNAGKNGTVCFGYCSVPNSHVERVGGNHNSVTFGRYAILAMADAGDKVAAVDTVDTERD
jgi:hypothetical protein